MSPVREELRQVLEDARAAGFLGPGPVEAHLQHAQGFAEAAEAALGHSPAHFVDLGTGGGIPGLVIGARCSRSRGVFIESNRRRCAALRDAVVRLGLENRVEVLEQRAEAAGRQGTYREGFELVTARSFAEPAVTAEIGAGLVKIGGVPLVRGAPPTGAPRLAPEEVPGVGFLGAPAVRIAQGPLLGVGKRGARAPLLPP